MNTQASKPFRLGFGQRATAFVFALACTLGTLLGVDGLSQLQLQEAQQEQMAQLADSQAPAQTLKRGA